MGCMQFQYNFYMELVPEEYQEGMDVVKMAGQAWF